MPINELMIMLMFLIIVIAVVVVFTIGKIGISRKWESSTLFKREMVGLYIVYIFALLVVTVLSREARTDDLPDILIPFSHYYFIINNGYPWYYDNMVILDVVNAMLFVPLGVLACEATEKRILLPLISGFCVSLVIEILQLLTGRGIFDVNDIIYNTLGTLIGCGICALGKLIWKRIAVKADDGENN